MSPAVCCRAVAVCQILLCPLNFSLECPPLSAMMLLFFTFCSYFSSSCSISVYLRVLHCWWRYFCWLNVLWFTIRCIALLIWDEFHFPWSARIKPGPHIISATVVSAFVALCIQSPLAIGVNNTYVDSTQEAMGLLTSLATSFWSYWQP